MTTKQTPKFDEVIDGVRIRVYATRGEYLALAGDGDLDDPVEDVWGYPKVGPAEVWAHQHRANTRNKDG